MIKRAGLHDLLLNFYQLVEIFAHAFKFLFERKTDRVVHDFDLGGRTRDTLAHVGLYDASTQIHIV
jgi:hypothetical protein